MPATASRLSKMAPRARKTLSATDSDYKVRFAVGLRKELDRKGYSASVLLAKLQALGLDVDLPAVNSWLRGVSMPRPADMPKLGDALEQKDYRKLYPPR